ncbi:guanine-1-methyltransferase-domain-containing protein [Chaetomium sp. MPI-SDFR-AT-0129]|nr:guanine-1-methyltransferase-domain-containing protein [Chaetomium sp. MPI-SDFR-AT-0129]
MATNEAQNASADVVSADAHISTGNSDFPTANGKRKADSELDRAAKRISPATEIPEPTTNAANSGDGGGNSEIATGENPPLSKNQLKKLRKQQQWEDFKQDRRAKRKDKRHEKQARKRAEKEAIIAEAEAAGLDPAKVLQQQQKQPWKFRPVPVSFIIDCDFEAYMREPELVSLSSQLVRSYAMNRKSKYQAALHFSSWGGKLRERFETALKNTHHNWKNVGFHEADFKAAATSAREQMMGPDGGEVIDLIKPSTSEGEAVGETEGQDEEDVDRTVVYLTSESPHTLDRLEANTSYVIGGIVDRNREKGLCYNRAKEFKVRTAKLPIGEYMAMQSRYVLTTNQVVEIMAKWLECGDWGQAFMDVIPRRKGGTLKDDATGVPEKEGADDDDEHDGLGEAADQVVGEDVEAGAEEAP